jgi:hypothetical protein
LHAYCRRISHVDCPDHYSGPSPVQGVGNPVQEVPVVPTSPTIALGPALVNPAGAEIAKLAALPRLGADCADATVAQRTNTLPRRKKLIFFILPFETYFDLTGGPRRTPDAMQSGNVYT